MMRRTLICAAATLTLLTAPVTAFTPVMRTCLSSSLLARWDLQRPGPSHSPLVPRSMRVRAAVRTPLVPQCSATGGSGHLSVPKESEIKTLLTQRAYQNLIFLLGTLGRDTITADWLEGFGGHDGIRHYHGLNGLHQSGHEFMANLLTSPNEVVVVEFTRRGNGKRPDGHTHMQSRAPRPNYHRIARMHSLSFDFFRILQEAMGVPPTGQLHWAAAAILT